MTDQERTAHDVVDALLSGWTSGRAEVFAELCSPDVRWWLPHGDDELTGSAAVQRTLGDLFGPGDRLSVDAKVVGDHVAVVEMSAPARTDRDPSPITTVVEIEDGRVVSGRTYFDVADFVSR